eukprot:m.94423 g.94423  ORF g.94423 m.94423 type:complete len:118 (-) comp15002_c0_seq43:3821-4174(-)
MMPSGSCAQMQSFAINFQVCFKLNQTRPVNFENEAIVTQPAQSLGCQDGTSIAGQLFPSLLHRFKLHSSLLPRAIQHYWCNQARLMEKCELGRNLLYTHVRGQPNMIKTPPKILTDH